MRELDFQPEMVGRERELKELHDAGVITDEEYEQKRRPYVDRL